MPPTAYLVVLILIAAMVPATAADVPGQAFTQIAGFKLGVGTLTGIRRQLGPSTIRTAGDASEYEERLCYWVSAGTLSFLAGEVGGPNQLTGFELTSKRLPGCGRWPAGVPEPTRTMAGLSLGMSKSRFAAALPTARSIEGGRLVASFESKLPFTARDFKMFSPDIQDRIARGEWPADWDVVVSVVGRFEHRKLTELRVWKTVTN